MEAPNKIFIPQNIGIVSLVILMNNENPDDIVYIRKDLLLEWAKQSKQEMEQDLKGSNGLIRAMIATAISSFQEVIEKIESL